ncbi:MAG: ArnT family glycosyltransferase [Syntrophobacteraceae bacterium]
MNPIEAFSKVTTSKTLDEDLFYRRILRLTIIASVLIFIWGIWSVPLLDHNEARRAVVVREMLASGDWLVPTLNGTVYISKPPLFYWFAAIFALLFQSTAEWVIRLPSSLCALALTWLTYSRVKQWIGKWPALFCAIILVTSAEFTMYGRRAEIEMLMAFCCSLSMYFFMDFLQKPQSRKPLLICYAFLGLAFLTKGPVILIFVIVPLAVFWFFHRDSNILKGLSYYPGWLLFAFIAFPWFIYLYFHLGKTSLAAVAQRDIVGKTFWAKSGGPWYAYFLVIIPNFAPWILVVAYKTKDQFRKFRSSGEAIFFWCWSVAPFVVMSFFAAKHAKYLTPLFPAVAVVLGTWLETLLNAMINRFGRRAYSTALWVAAIMLGLWFAYYAAIEPRLYSHRYTLTKPFIEKIEQVRGNVPVYAFASLDPRITYYYGKPIPVKKTGDLSRMIGEKKPFVLIVEKDEFPEIQGNADLCSLAEFKPFFRKDNAMRIYGTASLCDEEPMHK